MLARNEDKSRFHGERKQKMARRKRTDQLLERAAAEPKSADPSAHAKPQSVSA